MELLELIKQQLRSKGLPEKYAPQVKAMFNIENDEQVDGAVDNFKENVFSLLQSEGDRRATEAAKTAVENYQKKNPPKKEEKKTELQSQPEEGGETELQKQLSELSNVVKGMVKAQETSIKSEQAKQALLDAGIPAKHSETWLKQFDYESETPLEDQATAFKSEYDGLVQDLLNDTIETGLQTPVFKSDGELSVDDYREMMDNREFGDEGTVDLGLDN